MMVSSNLITESKIVFPEYKAWKNIIVPINKTEKVTLIPDSGSVGLLFSRDDNPFIFYGKAFEFKNLYDILSLTNSETTVPLTTLKELSTVLKKNAISVEFASDAVVYTYKNKDDANDIIGTKLALEPLSNDKLPEIEFIKEIKINEQFMTNEILKLFLDDSNELTDVRTHRKLFEFPLAKIWSILDKTNTFIRFSKEEKGRRFVEIYSKNDSLELHQLFLTI